MEGFRPQNVYVDLSRVGIDLKTWTGLPGANEVDAPNVRKMRHFGDGELSQDVPSRRTIVKYVSFITLK